MDPSLIHRISVVILLASVLALFFHLLIWGLSYSCFLRAYTTWLIFFWGGEGGSGPPKGIRLSNIIHVLGVMTHIYISSTWVVGKRQGDQAFQATLCYRLSSMPTWAT